MERLEIKQWMMWVEVVHGPRFGHALVLKTVGRTTEPFEVARWSWTGIGVPEGLLRDAAARTESVLVEHLTTRYGIAAGLF